MKWIALFVGLTTLAGCGGGSECAAGTCSCPDVQSCPCPTGMTCNWSGGTCASGHCAFTCYGAGTTCKGTCPGTQCLSSCSAGSTCDVNSGDQGIYDCDGAGSTCTFSVGKMGQVNCTTGSICHISCTGACQVNCASSTCDLKCAGDSMAKSVTGMASC